MDDSKLMKISEAADTLCDYCGNIDMETPECDDCMVTRLANAAQTEYVSKTGGNRIKSTSVSTGRVIDTLRHFYRLNLGDFATECIVVAIGADLLDISIEDMCKIIKE